MCRSDTLWVKACHAGPQPLGETLTSTLSGLLLAHCIGSNDQLVSNQAVPWNDMHIVVLLATNTWVKVGQCSVQPDLRPSLLPRAWCPVRAGS